MSPSARAGDFRRAPPRRDRLARRNTLHALTIVVCLAVIVGSFLNIMFGVERASRATAAAETSYRTIAAAQTLFSTLQDVETGQRGFILTGEASFLGPYRQALAHVAAERQTLAALARGDRTRTPLAAIDARIGDKLAISARTVAMARAGRIEEARAIVASSTGRRSMDRARTAFAAFLRAERATLAQRRAEAVAAMERARRLALVGTLLTLAAGTLAAVISRRTTTVLLRRADQAARARRRFRATFDQAAVGIAHVSPAGVVLRANAQLCEITGYQQAQLVGSWFEAITHPDDVPHELASRRGLLLGEGEQYCSEYRCLRGDGSTVWISVTVSLVRDASGAPDFFVSVVKDIADRKRAEAQLLTGEAQYRAIYDSAVEAIAVIDARGRIKSVNPAALRIFGYDADELLGKNVAMLMPEPTAGAHDGYLESYRRTGKRAIIGIGREVEGRRKDGSVFPLDLSVAEWSSEGETFYTGIMRDISERKLAERALAEGEARFRLTQEAVQAGNWETDLRTNHSTLSAESMRLFGFEHQRETTFEQGELSALVDPVDGARTRARFLRAVADGKRLDAVMRVTLSDGSSRWIQTIGQPIYDEDGRPLRMIGLNIDVTDQRQTEQALLESQERLRTLQNEFAHLARVNELGELAAAIAHEINQPLTAIANYLNTGRFALGMIPDADIRGVAALVEAADVMHLAAEQSIRAGEIVRRLRAFVAKGTGARRAEQIDTIVDTAMSLSLVDAELSGIMIDRHRGAPGVLVRVEAIQIQQVLVNLLRNAIDALLQRSDQDARQLTIATRLAGGGSSVEVMVRDSGPGILPEVMARLFEPFVTSKAHGMGMGLSLSRRLIEAHGGAIAVESTPGRGATFRFTLPVATAEEPSDDADEEPVPHDGVRTLDS